MQIIYLDSFKNDLEKIQNKPTKKKIKSAILKIENAPSLNKITNIKSIKGKKNAYRLRAGDYRIGFL